MIPLDILSDPICPWCYIGKTQLDRALAERPDHPFEIAWHPFQLNPDMPREGRDRRSYLEAKFGGPERAAGVYGQIAQAAKGAGIEIDFASIPRTPNTLDAHRLIHWAGLAGRQDAVVDALFKAYFHDGRDIGDADTLTEIATACGLDGAMTARLLAGDGDRAELAARDAQARARGVRGVPTFIIGARHVLTGAQPVDVWTKVIDGIASGEIGFD